MSSRRSSGRSTFIAVANQGVPKIGYFWIGFEAVALVPRITTAFKICQHEVQLLAQT